MSCTSLTSCLSSFLTLLAATPEASLASLLPELGQLRAALLASVEGEELLSPVKEEHGRKEDDSGIDSPADSPEKEVKAKVKMEASDDLKTGNYGSEDLMTGSPGSEDVKTGSPGSEDLKTGSPDEDVKTGIPGEDLKTGSSGASLPSLGGSGEGKRGARRGGTGKVASVGPRSSDPRCVMFSLQAGPGYEVTQGALEAAMAQFGPFLSCTLRTGGDSRAGNFGCVVFRDEVTAAAATHQVVQVGECTLYTRLPRERFTEQPVPHQVLVESSTFPQLWERDLLLRQFFSQFGQVDALDWVGNWPAGGLKLIVSFKDASVAQSLVGSTLKMVRTVMDIKEVSTHTLPKRSQAGGIKQ